VSWCLTKAGFFIRRQGLGLETSDIEMDMNKLRVSLFACAYNEIDGMANTVRHFEAFAKRQNLPLLNIHGGFDQYHDHDGSVERLELRRRWPKFAIDYKHEYDLNLWRYLPLVEKAVREFRPDLVHITGPSDIGQMGALIAHRLRLPLAASWHTNLHEYAERRFIPMVEFLPKRSKEALGRRIRESSLRLIGLLYRKAQVLFAPNNELIAELEGLTGRRCYLMSRGIDTELFHPKRRSRADGQFLIGYVGRLTKEKNVRFFKELVGALGARGGRNFRMVVVGQGAEFPWLLKHLPRASFSGVLRGEALADAYASFDAFTFPSHTDTFGNVVLEALASGVPAVVTSDGGPKFIVEHEKSGFIAKNEMELIEYIDKLRRDPDLLAQMRLAARDRAEHAPSWDSVFSYVYDIYEKVALRMENSHLSAPSFEGVPPVQVRTKADA
jgi:phosphatidylinositol alpha 1,6-mannosyltransferase